MILRHCGMRFGLVIVVLAMSVERSLASAAARSVLGTVTPDTMGMGEDLRIRWNYEDGNGGSRGKFDIALYKCDDAFCLQDDCGVFVQDLCDHPMTGCGDGQGDYWTTIPTNLTAANSYKIRVGLHGSTLFDCSSTFSIIKNIPTPTMEVFSPVVVAGGIPPDDSNEYYGDGYASEVVETFSQPRRHLRTSSSSSLPQLDGEMEGYAEANDTLLISWAYDDGFGGSFARFNIDLYYCGGSCSTAGNCGEIIARLCEACPDSAGNELVVLPDPYSSHNYKIRVSTWSGVGRKASACSPKFEIRARDRPRYSTPSPTALPEENEPPSLYPRPPPAPISAEDLPTDPVVKPTEYPDWGEEYVPPVQAACNSSDLPEVRYAGSTKRIYIERNGTRGGCFTLTQIWESGKRPLYPIDPSTNDRATSPTGVWLLTEDLYVLDGVTLQLHGTAKNGDCDELRLLSDEQTYLNLRAHGGSLSLLGTKVISWDESKKTVDTNHEDGRSYISAVSERIYDPNQKCNGTAKEERGETRMDVIDSEVAYLGHYDSESYGLVWKVRGFCIDKSNEEVFANVNVYGDMINSNIHHNYFGHYSYGHQGGNWSYNKMHDNVEYGFDPHDDSDYLTIVGNDVWGNGNHGIIASKRCDHVTIANNHVSYGVNTGIFLHRSSDHAIVSGNHVHNNGDAGLAVLESFYMDVHDNVFKDNRYGIRFSVGAGYNWINNNIINRSFRYNIFTYLGSDLPDVADTTGFPIGNVFWRNYIGGTYVDTIKLKEADHTIIVNNRITSAATIMFDQCSETTYRDNTVEDYLTYNVKTDSCFSGDSDSDLDPKC